MRPHNPLGTQSTTIKMSAKCNVAIMCVPTFSVKPAGADEEFPRGAGLSGLTLALALRKLAPEVEFKIYEGATQLSEVGAGLSLQERPWSIMQALGLDTVLKPIAGGGENQSTITNASGARPKVADRLP